MADAEEWAKGVGAVAVGLILGPHLREMVGPSLASFSPTDPRPADYGAQEVTSVLIQQLLTDPKALGDASSKPWPPGCLAQSLMDTQAGPGGSLPCPPRTGLLSLGAELSGCPPYSFLCACSR